MPLTDRATTIIAACSARNPTTRAAERLHSNGVSPTDEGTFPRRQTSSRHAAVPQSGELLHRIGVANWSPAVATTVRASASKRNRGDAKLRNPQESFECKVGSVAGDTSELEPLTIL